MNGLVFHHFYLMPKPEHWIVNASKSKSYVFQPIFFSETFRPYVRNSLKYLSFFVFGHLVRNLEFFPFVYLYEINSTAHKLQKLCSIGERFFFQIWTCHCFSEWGSKGETVKSEDTMQWKIYSPRARKTRTKRWNYLTQHRRHCSHCNALLSNTHMLHHSYSLCTILCLASGA